MRLLMATTLLALCGGLATATVPDVTTFRAAVTYPAPAAGATLTLGASDTQTGRLVVWDGNTVYRQSITGSVLGGAFTASGTGYVGDPTFVGVLSNTVTVILGSGADGLLYRINNVSLAADFTADTAITVPTFNRGALMGDRYVVLDRTRDDLVGAEIVLVDLAASPPTFRTVLQKPAGSGSAAMTLNPGDGRLLVMNPTTRELRSFSQAAIITAFTNSTMLDWSTDGTAVGAIGQFLNGGVYGVTPQGELVLGGDENAAGTGGIQWVNPNSLPASILATLDPAGTMPPYVLIYSRKLDQVIAIDPTVSPPVAYASTKIIPFIPPDSPCTIFNDVLTEFTAFVAQFSPGATDLDGDEIRDTAMLQLFKMFSCQANTTTALAYATNVAYDDNRETFALEPNASALSAYSHIIPVLMSMSQAMQTYTLGLLSDGGTPLAGAYESVDCTDLTHCTPLFVEDPVLPATRTATEPYTAAGDADFDGFTNLTEYQNIIAIGGSDFDFAVHASTKGLNGTGGVQNSGGGCFIATAAYGTPMANELNRLRAVRDASLLTRPAGAAIVDAYYRLSPPAAAWIADRPSARAAVRALLAIALYRNIGFVLGASFIAGLALFVIVSRRTAGAVQRK